MTPVPPSPLAHVVLLRQARTRRRAPGIASLTVRPRIRDTGVGGHVGRTCRKHSAHGRLPTDTAPILAARRPLPRPRYGGSADIPVLGSAPVPRPDLGSRHSNGD